MFMRWLDVPKDLLARLANRGKAGEEEEGMKCKKCSKDMKQAEFVIKELTKARGSVVDQLTMCQECGQSYMCNVVKGKVKMEIVNETWIKARPKSERVELRESVKLLQNLNRQLKLAERWKGYMA